MSTMTLPADNLLRSLLTLTRSLLTLPADNLLILKFSAGRLEALAKSFATSRLKASRFEEPSSPVVWKDIPSVIVSCTGSGKAAAFLETPSCWLEEERERERALALHERQPWHVSSSSYDMHVSSSSYDQALHE